MSTPHPVATDASNATATRRASASARHAEGHPGPQHGSAAGFDPTAAAPPGLDANMGATPGAHDPGPRRRAKTVSPTRERHGSRLSLIHI